MGGPPQVPPAMLPPGMPPSGYWQGQWIPHNAYPPAPPQWVQQVPFQPPAQPQPTSVESSGTKHPTVDELVDAVVARMGKNNSQIAPSSSNDKVIMDAANKVRSKDLTLREAIEKLGDVRHKHSTGYICSCYSFQRNGHANYSV